MAVELGELITGKEGLVASHPRRGRAAGRWATVLARSPSENGIYGSTAGMYLKRDAEEN